ncbi:hypothetical protein [Aequorivita lipolytica]|uniref:Uncharacterized protein n=1 Tax=Aequorivita lipolytica TaxID=153267 RepID=A0A5C6YSW5_9FLAO|nr:hypothetical protein [Aequorivita lipolytica]TXD70387.1 hypothetical protein ESV24_04265 [Aequorivita lipolytica]SRX50817.1 hypothetical protein AEQU2_01295 [Aequorivita lipolytica]
MKNVIFLFCLLLGIIGHAQLDSLKISASEIFKDEKYKTTLLFAKEDTNGDIFTVRNYYSSISNPKGYYIEHYSKDLKLLKRTTFEVNRNEIKGVFLTADSVVLLQFQYNYKEKKYAFATLTSSKEDFNFSEKEIYALDRTRLNKYDHFGIRSEPEYSLHYQNNLGDFVESENGEFIALNLFTKTKEGDALLVITFNKNFEKIYEYEFENLIALTESPTKKLQLEYLNMVMDNEGTVYFLGRVFNNGDIILEKKNAPNYYFILFSADAVSKKQQLISIESNNIIRSLQLVNKVEKLAAVGLYIDPSTTGSFDNYLGYSGVVRFNIDPKSLATSTESFRPFSEEFMVEKYGKVKEKLKSFLSYRSTFMLENGDVIINAEEFEIYIADKNAGANRIYKDIISCRINSNGELVWAKNINKKQSAWSPHNIPFLSYASTTKNNVFYYFVNAASDLKILKNNEIEFKEGPKLYLLKMYETGAFRYDKILFPDIYNAHLGLRFGVLLNESDILVQAESNDKPMMVKLYF